MCFCQKRVIPAVILLCNNHKREREREVEREKREGKREEREKEREGGTENK